METLAPDEIELSELGFEKAATQLTQDKEFARKLRIAFEHFRVVEPKHITRFNEELKARTHKAKGSNQWGQITSYDTLKFTGIAEYTAVPPKPALEALRHAKTLGCFDGYEIATIESVEVVPDPILFGTITGSGNKYFIAQWDDDVKIEDILHVDEG